MVTYWLISSNDSIFRLEDCLNGSQYVDWQSSFSPKVGDVVFIYRTKPTQRVCYMMEVVAINIPYRKTINDIISILKEQIIDNNALSNETLNKSKFF